MTQFAQCLRFYLADALARHVELFSDLFKRAGETVGQTETVVQHLTFAVGQRRQYLLQPLAEHRIRRLLRWILGCRVRDEIAILGVINMTGNISSLHWYHRQRVAEEDRLPFGKAVGLGTLICGLSCILFGVSLLLYEWVTWEPLIWITVGVLFLGLSVGIVLTLKAILKYNKGLF